MKVRTSGAVQGIMFLIVLPLSFASNTFVNPDTMPSWLQTFVKINPISQLVTTMRGLMIGGPVAGEPDVDAGLDGDPVDRLRAAGPARLPQARLTGRRLPGRRSEGPGPVPFDGPGCCCRVGSTSTRVGRTSSPDGDWTVTPESPRFGRARACHGADRRSRPAHPAPAQPSSTNTGNATEAAGKYATVRSRVPPAPVGSHWPNSPHGPGSSRGEVAIPDSGLPTMTSSSAPRPDTGGADQPHQTGDHQRGRRRWSSAIADDLGPEVAARDTQPGKDSGEADARCVSAPPTTVPSTAQRLRRASAAAAPSASPAMIIGNEPAARPTPRLSPDGSGTTSTTAGPAAAGPPS